VRYVVTGAAGFIGSHLTERLLADGHDVTAVDSFNDYYDPAEKRANADAFDVEQLDLAEEPLELDGVDGVFHIAGQPGVRSFGDVFPVYVRRNIIATQRVLEAAGGIRVVYASSSSIYGNAEAYPTHEDAVPQPISPYGITKLACEHLARAYGGDAVGLRYFTVYGPRQRPDMFFRRVCDALQEGTQFEIFGTGEQSRSYTEVADAVDATVAAMERAPAGIYNVGGGDEASMLEAIALLEEISGRTLDLRHVDAARGDVARTKADVTRIREATGWEPRTSLRDGLERMWSWVSGRVAAS